jgi:phage shock protein A
MDNLQQLATNALLDHWPPHLGVTTDAEKIAYLAERLREAGDVHTLNEELQEENSKLAKKVDDLESNIEDLEEEIGELKAKGKQ